MNLFVEGWPSPVVLSVELRRDAQSFQDVSEIAAALSEIDKTLRGPWARAWPSFDRRRSRDVWLLRFRVESPPFFDILTDPAWLAVLLLILTHYKQGKESIQEMGADLNRLLSGIKGLSGRQLQLLHIAVGLTMERWLQLGEEESIKMAKRFRRIRKRLMGDSEEPPTIEVKDIDSKYRLW